MLEQHLHNKKGIKEKRVERVRLQTSNKDILQLQYITNELFIKLQVHEYYGTKITLSHKL